VATRGMAWQACARNTRGLDEPVPGTFVGMADKRALCVGINYPGTSSQLSGCVNDAVDWAELLRANGYSQVQVLLDAAATKDAILRALRENVAALGWGDRLVVTYSGHGTWVPDRDGDEVDRRDEALCPTDFQQGRLITDDELQPILGGNRAGSGVLFLSDSCHSGTVSRLAMTGVTPAGQPRFVSPAEFMDSMTEERAADLEARVDTGTPRKSASLVSGCLDQEYSYDAYIRGRYNGAFSRAAIDTYRAGISLNNWHKAIRGVLPNNSYPQTPALTPASLYRKYSKAL
jgi:metacaspase-1